MHTSLKPPDITCIVCVFWVQLLQFLFEKQCNLFGLYIFVSANLMARYTTVPSNISSADYSVEGD
jgi:hypothetical protein